MPAGCPPAKSGRSTQLGHSRAARGALAGDERLAPGDRDRLEPGVRTDGVEGWRRWFTQRITPAASIG